MFYIVYIEYFMASRKIWTAATHAAVHFFDVSIDGFHSSGQM